MSARRFYLGGAIAPGEWWRKGSFGPLLGVIVISLILITIGAAFAGPVGLGIAFLISGGLGFLSLRKSASGATQGSLAQTFLTRWLLNRAGWSSFDPDDEDLPIALGNVRTLAYSAEEGKPELALIEHLDDGYMSATIWLRGRVSGIRDELQEGADSQLFGLLLRGLAEDALPVSQIDITTRATPADSAEYLAWGQEAWAHAPHELGASQAELAGWVEGGVTYLSWLTVKMPTQQLAARAELMGLPPTLESVAATAYDVVGDVARRVRDAGLQPTTALPPRTLGALMRHIMIPAYRPSDLEGIDRVWDGLRFGYQHEPRGFALEVVDPAVEPGTVITPDTQPDVWYHAVGHVPLMGWPKSVLRTDWLESLVVGSTAPIQTITTSLVPIPRIASKETARTAIAGSGAKHLREANAGKVATGEEMSTAAAGMWMLNDIVDGGSSGVAVTLRVMVSSPDPKNLMLTRGEIESRVIGAMDCIEFDWYDKDHARALMTMLPLGRGMKTNRKVR